jgi:hypothetical protein
VRRVILQTKGTIFNTQTQILGSGEDIDIMGRSQEAVWEVFLALEGEANKVESRRNDRTTMGTKILKSIKNLYI